MRRFQHWRCIETPRPNTVVLTPHTSVIVRLEPNTIVWQSCLVTIEWAARAQSSRKCGHLLPHNGIVSQERQSKVTVRNQDNVSGHLSNFIRISMNTKIKSDNRQVLESNWIMYHPYSALWINLDLLNSVHLTSASYDQALFHCDERPHSLCSQGRALKQCTLPARCRRWLSTQSTTFNLSSSSPRVHYTPTISPSVGGFQKLCSSSSARCASKTKQWLLKRVSQCPSKIVKKSIYSIFVWFQLRMEGLPVSLDH